MTIRAVPGKRRPNRAGLRQLRVKLDLLDNDPVERARIQAIIDEVDANWPEADR